MVTKPSYHKSSFICPECGSDYFGSSGENMVYCHGEIVNPMTGEFVSCNFRGPRELHLHENIPTSLERARRLYRLLLKRCITNVVKTKGTMSGGGINPKVVEEILFELHKWEMNDPPGLDK